MERGKIKTKSVCFAFLLNHVSSSSTPSVLKRSVTLEYMANELERIWKEAVMARFKVLRQHLPEGTNKSHKKKLPTIVGVPAMIRTGHVPEERQKSHHLSQFARFQFCHVTK
jgi:hypothetical protein